MIKITKGQSPQVLIDYHVQWTTALNDAISTYGGYSNIPKQQRETILSHYRHRDIVNALAASSHSKCAFCECMPQQGGYIEIDHFLPKSLYPDLTFEWNNLLPICKNCNVAKSDHDTRLLPIIDPSQKDPAALLTYNFLTLCPITGTGEEQLAARTIEVCCLNSSRLYKERANILQATTEYMDTLQEAICSVKASTTDLQKKRRLRNLRTSLETIDGLLTDENLYAGYHRWCVNQFTAYQEAKKLVEGLDAESN